MRDLKHQQQEQPSTGTQATVAFPGGGTAPPGTAHRQETQSTPVVRWTPGAQQQQPQPAGASRATQVAEAGGRPGAAAAPAPSQAQASQAGAAPNAWQQLAIGMLELLAPHGVPKQEAVLAMKQLSGEKQLWLAKGPRALADDVCRRLGKPPLPAP